VILLEGRASILQEEYTIRPKAKEFGVAEAGSNLRLCAGTIAKV
jgi:hypothetical protein